jgi:phage baseplate assembly protein W
MKNLFVGRGWAFPLRTDANGSVTLVSDEREIEEAIRLILGTSYGERPMRPDFGCAIHDHVFAPIDSSTGGVLEWEVRQSLERWEPRITVNLVEVSYDEAQPSLLYIDVRYTINDTNSPRNLVFPFYTIPQEA